MAEIVVYSLAAVMADFWVKVKGQVKGFTKQAQVPL